MKMPRQLKAEQATNLREAQKLYARLGNELVRTRAAQLAREIDRPWKKEAVQVRRELIEEYGPIVRMRERSYTRRPFMTIPKSTIREAPYATTVIYDQGTGEPLRILDMARKDDRLQLFALLAKLKKDEA
jgi:hypothetical protein